MNEPSSSLLLLKSSDFSSSIYLTNKQLKTDSQQEQLNENYFRGISEHETSLEDDNDSPLQQQIDQHENIQVNIYGFFTILNVPTTPSNTIIIEYMKNRSIIIYFD